MARDNASQLCNSSPPSLSLADCDIAEDQGPGNHRIIPISPGLFRQIQYHQSQPTYHLVLATFKMANTIAPLYTGVLAQFRNLLNAVRLASAEEVVLQVWEEEERRLRTWGSYVGMDQKDENSLDFEGRDFPNETADIVNILETIRYILKQTDTALDDREASQFHEAGFKEKVPPK